ncbi:MAG: hypothetical protein EP329_23225 [Deltaproteobacteria bacterium]|nr:MAG: hypothetical protein EP329_23225 [Deltaproteobacteria bacterium]
MRPVRIALASTLALLALSSVAHARGPGARDRAPAIDFALDDDDGFVDPDFVDPDFVDPDFVDPDVAGTDCDEAPLPGERFGPALRGDAARESRRPAELARTFPVQILWGGSWWNGTLLAKRNGQYYIHYTGYDDSWNEWVGPDRIRFSRPERVARPIPSQVRPARILWGGRWWDGTVLSQRGGQYYIHYTGYDDSWNEWVGPDRIRLQ